MRFSLLVSAFVLMTISTAWAQATPPADEKKPDPAAEEPDADDPDADEPDADEPPAAKPPVEKAKPAVPPTSDSLIDDDDDELMDDDDDDPGDDGWGEEEAEPSYPRIEHKGYFRFRADMFSNMHLGTNFREGSITQGTSAFLPPLTENQANNEGNQYPADVVGAGVDETFVASANLRFRYQPTFHISPSFKFTATFDVMDNLVMGSTPDFHIERPDVPFSAFSGSQAPPGDNYQFKDSIRVKEVYGEWKLLGIPFRFGRMSSDWGLGMLANDGDGWDDDFGDYQDRIMLALKLYGIYIFGGYDVVSSGPTYKQPFQPLGQAYDMTETDDVQQGFIGIFQRPIQDEEIVKRRERLVKERKPAFDWGVYTVFRTQKLDLDNDSLAALRAGEVAGANDCGNNGPKECATSIDGLGLVKRDAWAVIPDLWLRFEYRPSYTTRVHIELEAAMIIGNVGKVTDDAGEPERDLLSWGVAFESDYTTGGLTIGLDAGAASGDDAEYLTVQDQKNFEVGGVKNTKITNFKFDRNYHVDQILFREVIGSVTNAAYIKPYVRYDLFDSPDGAIGGRLDILTAFALEKDAYPGNETYLGTEFDMKIFIEDSSKFYADLSFGLFLPGAAFDLKKGYTVAAGSAYTGEERSAELAWTLQTHIVLKY